MRKKTLTIFLLAFLFLWPANSILSYGIENPLATESFEELANTIINFIIIIGVALAPILFIVAGLMFITAAGNPSKIEKAKKMILYTVIGLVFLLLAKGLVAVIKSILGGKEEEVFFLIYFSNLKLKYFLNRQKVDNLINT